jgi:NADH dehydrogenase FAD-containing subunit
MLTQGYFATQHGQLTAKNLKALIKNKDVKLEEWKSPKAMFLSLGASAGSGHLGGCVFPSCMVAGQKSKDLFIGKVRAELGVK